MTRVWTVSYSINFSLIYEILHKYLSIIPINDEQTKGTWVRGKRHGTGEYTYNDGTKFEGAWENDKINGEWNG